MTKCHTQGDEGNQVTLELSTYRAPSCVETRECRGSGSLGGLGAWEKCQTNVQNCQSDGNFATSYVVSPSLGVRVTVSPKSLGRLGSRGRTAAQAAFDWDKMSHGFDLFSAATYSQRCNPLQRNDFTDLYTYFLYILLIKI